MGRRAVEVIIVFLDVFAVIAFAIRQAEQPLLEDRVLAVPQSNGKTQPLVVVAEAGEAVLTPVIGARASLVVGKVVPSIAVLAVVLADRAPLALAEIRPNGACRKVCSDPIDLAAENSPLVVIKTELYGGRTGINDADHRRRSWCVHAFKRG